MAEPIEIMVNGEPRSVAPGTTVAGLIEALGVTGQRVAVERNLDVVPRSTYGTVELVAGDCLEVVAFVGGG